MYSYIFKKIVHSSIVILAVVSTVYVFQSYSVIDPVDDFMTSSFGDKPVNKAEYEKAYIKEAKRQSKNLPSFYFSIVPSYFPDTLHKIIFQEDKTLINQMLRYSQCAKCTQQLWIKIENISDLATLENTQNAKENSILKKISREKNWNKLDYLFSSLKSINGIEQSLPVKSILKSYEEMDNHKKTIFFPKILWHGLSNQFHAYLKGLLKGDLGLSKSDGRSVSSKIKKALKWTLSMNTIAFVLAASIGLFIGLWSIKKDGSRLEKVITSVLFFIYTMPVFWTATLLVVFFTSERYGVWANIFPSAGIKYWYADKTVSEQIMLNASQLILPVLCITLPSLAYVSRIMKSKFSEVLSFDFITSLKAKGISEKRLYNRHVLKNGMIPYITILTGSIPGLFAGSLVIEIIFSIPGIGKLLLDSIYGSDWGVISGLVIMLSLVTVLAYLLADILYSWANPRINIE